MKGEDHQAEEYEESGCIACVTLSLIVFEQAGCAYQVP